MATMRSETLDTRAALLEAAIAVIEESGESGFRIGIVLERVGVASTAIYHHFGSRDDLVDSANAERYLRSLYVPRYEEIEQRILHCETTQEFSQLLQMMVEAGGDQGATSRRRTRVSVLGSAISRPSLAVKVGEANATFAREMAATFGPAQQRGWIRSDLDLQAAAMWVVGQSTGRLMLELGDPGIDEWAWARLEAEAIVTILKGGLR